ncbi:hypothetical protein BKP35_05260 [Anaerobacillus arseniciselenatis]|uniref:Uncharacterized protein n=1 Tax=Anaerobacillus arseniciselenatis TaxID=85682 RepID=A0A1S2LRW9_9BACI|nr:hypothetical protein [Anaerobacillus arseniciselenatis]OIJ15258.1 hypothetical protein BKP35_05260 [Anaerobacillus arseniciselenatis]
MNSNLLKLKERTDALVSSKEKLNKYEEMVKALNDNSISPKNHVQNFMKLTKQMEQDEPDKEEIKTQLVSNIKDVKKELDKVELYIKFYEAFITFLALSITANNEALPIYEKLTKRRKISQEYFDIFASLILDDTSPTEITNVEVTVLKDKIKESEKDTEGAKKTLKELQEAQSQLQKIISLYQKALT